METAEDRVNWYLKMSNENAELRQELAALKSLVREMLYPVAKTKTGEVIAKLEAMVEEKGLSK